MYLGPKMGAVLDKWGWGQSAQIGPIWHLITFSCTKSKFKGLFKNCRPKAIGWNIFMKYFNLFFTILGLSFNFQTNILWKSWDSLTNHCFWPWPWPIRPLAERKGGRDIRTFIAHRVTEPQNHTTSTPFRGGWNLLCPLKNNFPTCFACRGITVIF